MLSRLIETVAKQIISTVVHLLVVAFIVHITSDNEV